ncbi:hypothetical protein [Grimontia hollisae]|uniref:hypothetical protein n=1 Tax=Grimontia hollisae TaxID=673 RepID=UPI000DFBE830|nr:hypothetical protein [Grimontia hollisae]STQ75530.1 Uncharacterised protein [Grimontia hollisae]
MLLQQAQALFKQGLTLESLRQLDALEKQASGKEAEQIGDLWEAVYASADEALLDAAAEEGLL